MSSLTVRPHLVLLAVCVAALILPLSFSGGAIATPAIGRDLAASPLAMSWITNAFMLTFGSLLMAAGSLADRFGRKRLFVAGVGLFLLASVLSAWAPDILWLDTLRAVQGVAAAAALAGGSAALADTFDGVARTWAFSLLGTSFGVGLAVGPMLAGRLIAQFGWRAVFYVIALVAAVALIPAVCWMRESRDPAAGRLDWWGVVSFSSSLTLFTWAMLQAPDSGWLSPLIVGLFVMAAVLLLVFVVVEQRQLRPMLDLSLFRYPRFIGVQLLPIATCYCFVVLLVLLPIRFIGIDGLDELHAGLAMAALCAPMLIVPSLAAWLSRWFAAGTLCGSGLLIAAFGLYLLGHTEAGRSSETLLAMLVIGIGSGLPWGLMDGLSVSLVPTERAGMAAGLFSTTRVAGEGVALAIVLALLGRFVHNALGAGEQGASVARHLVAGDMPGAMSMLPGVERAALVSAYNQGFTQLTWVLIAITVVTSLVVFVFLGRPREAVATARQL